MDAVQYAIDQNLGKVISVSYGLCEPQTPRSDALTMQSWARQGNAQGITWVNASGDSGGADCVTADSTRNAGLSVDIPAGIPEVTGIGGTSFSEGSGTFWNATTAPMAGRCSTYIPEATWNDSTDGDPAAGGGGASTYFSKPTGRWAPVFLPMVLAMSRMFRSIPRQNMTDTLCIPAARDRFTAELPQPHRYSQAFLLC